MFLKFIHYLCAQYPKGKGIQGKRMNTLLNIAHPFLTVEDFQQRAGRKLAKLIHRLAGKYPQLSKSCGVGRMLVAVSVAWGMTSAARAGNQAMLEHIDEALSPYQRMGYVMEPPGGCITVEGHPFLLADEEQAVRRFLWDGFAIFIDHEGTGNISQAFFDLADTHQWKAYTVMSEDNQEKLKTKSQESETKERKTQEETTTGNQPNTEEINNQESQAKGTNIHHQSNTSDKTGVGFTANDKNNDQDIRATVSILANKIDKMQDCLERIIVYVQTMEENKNHTMEQNRNQTMELNQTFNYFAPIGQQIAHVDKIEAHFDKNMGITVDGQDIVPSLSAGTSRNEDASGASAPSSPDEAWIDGIVSCFMGDKERALEFVGMARHMKPKQITELVNAWMVMKRVSPLSCKRDLWKPLHEQGIYPCSESNWNAQVRIP